MPNVFSNMGKNYNTAYCHNDTSNQQCMFKHMLEHDVGYNCKKSCSSLEYFGEKLYDSDIESVKENWDIYLLEYTLVNLDFAAKVYEEYLIYDEIGMIGSVGGTLGMHASQDCSKVFFIKYLFFRHVCWILHNWNCFLDPNLHQKHLSALNVHHSDTLMILMLIHVYAS